MDLHLSGLPTTSTAPLNKLKNCLTSVRLLCRSCPVSTQMQNSELELPPRVLVQPPPGKACSLSAEACMFLVKLNSFPPVGQQNAVRLCAPCLYILEFPWGRQPENWPRLFPATAHCYLAQSWRPAASLSPLWHELLRRQVSCILTCILDVLTWNVGFSLHSSHLYFIMVKIDPCSSLFWNLSPDYFL